MDTISAYLNGMRIHDFEAGSAEARAPWGVAIPSGTWDIVLYAFDGAPCRLSLPDAKRDFRSAEHTICMVLNGKAHVVQDESLTDPNSLVEMRQPETIEQFRFKTLGSNTGPLTRVFYIGLDLGGWGNNPLLEALPAVLLRDFSEMPAWFQMGSSWLQDELLAQRPGRHSTAARLGELLIIEAVRSYVVEHSESAPAWLRPTRDARLTRALGLLHGNLSRSWTLDDLAELAGTSRSRLSACAQEELGEGIFQYLQRWRMFEARRLLRETAFEIGNVGRLVGYESQTAFITAFGRDTGLSPNRYRVRCRETETAAQPAL